MKTFKTILLSLLILILLIFTNTIFGSKINNHDLSLSRIYVEPGSLEPEFSPTRTYYTLILEPNTKNIVLQATPTDKTLDYEIKGNENLKEGENLITITVYSKDKSDSNTYTINALITDEPEKYNALLNTLIIDNYPFNEEFFPEVFNYTTTSLTTQNIVDVFAYPQNSNATIKISGNTNLSDSQNTITIDVTSENKLSTRQYTITINKGNTNEISRTNEITKTISNENIKTNNEHNSEFKTFIITTIIIILTLVLIIFSYNRMKK